MDRFTIRLAHREDAQAIVEVNQDTWTGIYSGVVDEEFIEAKHANLAREVEDFKAYFSNPQAIIFVAEVDGEVVAFANAGDELSGVYDGEVYALYVLEANHGIGIGVALLNRVKTLFHAQGKKNMLIWSLAANPYRGFYERMGGAEVSRRFVQIGKQELEEVGYLFKI